VSEVTVQADDVVWLSPSSPAERSAERVAEALTERAVIAPKDLEVWAPEIPDDYDLSTEVEGVARFAQTRQWASFHLVGFSAAATVALASALALGRSVKSLTLIEPATIGDDDWSDSEAAWRTRIAEIFELPPAAYEDAFSQHMMAPGVPPPSLSPLSAVEIERDVLQYRGTIRQTGFDSGRLRSLSQPVLVVTGGRSHPRFADVADRLVEVLGDVRAATFPECSHLHPPQRHEPERLAELLTELWSRS
jgi:pimeloyl-ACP methyl ester carboxylesterase